MATSMMELCEQTNPVVLAEARKAGRFGMLTAFMEAFWRARRSAH